MITMSVLMTSRDILYPSQLWSGVLSPRAPIGPAQAHPRRPLPWAPAKAGAPSIALGKAAMRHRRRRWRSSGSPCCGSTPPLPRCPGQRLRHVRGGQDGWGTSLERWRDRRWPSHGAGRGGPAGTGPAGRCGASAGAALHRQHRELGFREFPGRRRVQGRRCAGRAAAGAVPADGGGRPLLRPEPARGHRPDHGCQRPGRSAPSSAPMPAWSARCPRAINSTTVRPVRWPRRRSSAVSRRNSWHLAGPAPPPRRRGGGGRT